MPRFHNLGRIFGGSGFLAMVLAVVLVAGVAVPRLLPHQPVATAAPATAATDSIYAQTLDDAEGRPQSLSQWKGKLLVLNFWATWCAPCVAEMPDLEKAQREFAARNVVIVGVGTEAPARVREFRDHIGLHLPLLAGGYDALVLARALGDSQGVLPYTVLVSPGGAVLQTQTGPLRPGQLRGWLAAAP
jgi:thiol-disulfide isomerase/thioredoxin